MSDDLIAVAREWQLHDPDPVTRQEIDQLIVSESFDELASRFDGRLEFGTAGLRGAVGAGSNRMNRATVRRATAGLVARLDAEGIPGPVVIGRDARNGSPEFLDEVAAVVGGAGRLPVVLPAPCPTPLLAFAVLDQHAAAGVMITASHNPPVDNGYKVFLDDGAQVVTPVDEAISGHIDAVEGLAGIALDAERRTDADPGLVGRYLDAVMRTLLVPDARSTRIAYTAMHGVGGRLMMAACERAGFGPPAVVDRQFEPDATFPTVAFPNPEEPGAMDLLMATAEAADADLALAHDPDADRLGVAVRSADGWRRLRGDEIGILLADHLITHRATTGPAAVATTVVSSRMLFRLAEARGVEAIETLTGFKWVARAAPPDRLLFGYEEALGYAVSTEIRDKDGISAALVMAEAASCLTGTGRSLLDRLDELAAELGVHETAQVVVRAEGPRGMADLARQLEQLRADPPTSIAGIDVTSVEDLARGERLPATNALAFELDGGRVVLRPSGTEPKLKCYLEAVEAPGLAVGDAKRRAHERLSALGHAVSDLIG